MVPELLKLKIFRETDTKKIITILCDKCYRRGFIKTYWRAIDPNLEDERRLLGEKWSLHSDLNDGWTWAKRRKGEAVHREQRCV